MKILLILALMLLLGGILYWRLRPYLLVARKVFGTLREVRRMSVNSAHANAPRPKADTMIERLTRCATCQTWTPASRVVKIPGSKSVYCSHECLERAASAPRHTRSAS